MEDNRNDIMKKIDDLWDSYCDQFKTVIFRDQYNLADEDFYNIMLRSIDENIDYLSWFEARDTNKIDIISDITKGSNTELATQLVKAYDQLSMQNMTAEEQYAMLNYLVSSTNNLTKDVGSVIDRMTLTLKEQTLEEIKATIKQYIYTPKELSELAELRETVLAYVLNKSNTALDLSVTEINKRISELFNIVQITNYSYRTRRSVLSEFEYIKSEIEADLKYLISDNNTEFGSIGLRNKLNSTGYFVGEDFPTATSFTQMWQKEKSSQHQI